MSFIKLPGLIDPHVHLREPGATQKEDFTTGTRAAVAGGYTIILDMPNNPEPTITPESLHNKQGLSEGRIYSDLEFHFGATAQSIKFFNQVKDRVFALKVYMNQTTGNLLVDNESELEAIFSQWPRGYLIMVHAEEEKLEKAIKLANRFQQRLHVCHLSTKRQLLMVKEAKKVKMPITCEVTCHHLFLTDKDLKRLKSFGVMKPPLATQDDQKALWENLGIIDMLASDHAPHTMAEKSNLEKPPFGVPGLETSLPLLLNAMSEGRLSFEKLVDLTSAAARRVFKIPAQPETFVEVEITKEYKISNEKLETKAQWTPFAGMRVKGRVTKTVLRGITVYDGKNVVGRPEGRVIYPDV